MLRNFLTLLCLSACTLAHAGNILLNGDFETGNINNWTFFTTTNGDLGCPNFCGVALFDTTGTGATNALKLNVGSSAGGVSNGGGISQTINLATSGIYSFFANIASQDDVSGQINGSPGTFSILIDGTTLATNTLGGGGGFSTSFQIFTGTLSGAVNLTSGSHSFQVLVTRPFANGGNATPQQYVDNISLSTSATPEPATFGLAAVTLIGLGTIRRRGQKSR